MQESRIQHVILYEQTRVTVRVRGKINERIIYMISHIRHLAPLYQTRCMPIAVVIILLYESRPFKKKRVRCITLFRAVTYVQILHTVFYC